MLRPVHGTQGTSTSQIQMCVEIGTVSHSNGSSIENAVQVTKSIDEIQSGHSNNNENVPVVGIEVTSVAQPQKDGEIAAVLHLSDSSFEGAVRVTQSIDQNQSVISNNDENVDVFLIAQKNQPKKRRVRFESVDSIRCEPPNAATSARRTNRVMSLNTDRVHLYEANPIKHADPHTNEFPPNVSTIALSNVPFVKKHFTNQCRLHSMSAVWFALLNACENTIESVLEFEWRITSAIRYTSKKTFFIFLNFLQTLI